MRTWCPKCAGVNKGTIEEMREFAKSHGGECLSKEYLGAKEPLKWRCGTCNSYLGFTLLIILRVLYLLCFYEK